MMTEPKQSQFNDIKSIYDLLTLQAQNNPAAIALLTRGRTPLTYQGLFEQIAAIRTQLNAIGLGRHDRVALALPASAEMAVAFLAVAACATCAPLNPNYRQSEYDFYLADLNAKALIVGAGIAESAVTIAQKRGIPLIELMPITLDYQGF